MNRWLTEEEQRAWRGLLRMTSQLNARMNRQLQEDYGISLADYEVLVVLSEAPEGRLRVFEVADALAWEQSRVSHQLARMQRRGLITRQDCASDARGAFAVLTAAGRAAIERAAPAHVETGAAAGLRRAQPRPARRADRGHHPRPGPAGGHGRLGALRGSPGRRAPGPRRAGRRPGRWWRRGPGSPAAQRASLNWARTCATSMWAGSPAALIASLSGTLTATVMITATR